jgi:phosphomevalonate kinase
MSDKYSTEEMIDFIALQDETIPPGDPRHIAIIDRLREADILHEKVKELEGVEIDFRKIVHKQEQVITDLEQKLAQAESENKLLLQLNKSLGEQNDEFAIALQELHVIDRVDLDLLSENKRLRERWQKLREWLIKEYQGLVTCVECIDKMDELEKEKP